MARYTSGFYILVAGAPSLILATGAARGEAGARRYAPRASSASLHMLRTLRIAYSGMPSISFSFFSSLSAARKFILKTTVHLLRGHDRRPGGSRRAAGGG